MVLESVKRLFESFDGRAIGQPTAECVAPIGSGVCPNGEDTGIKADSRKPCPSLDALSTEVACESWFASSIRKAQGRVTGSLRNSKQLLGTVRRSKQVQDSHECNLDARRDSLFCSFLIVIWRFSIFRK